MCLIRCFICFVFVVIVLIASNEQQLWMLLHLCLYFAWNVIWKEFEKVIKYLYKDKRTESNFKTWNKKWCLRGPNAAIKLYVTKFFLAGPPDLLPHDHMIIPQAWGARVAQWWERPPPTNVARVQILASTPHVGWVCCWFSPLLREVFLWVVYVRFSPLLKNQHFQIPIRSGIG